MESRGCEPGDTDGESCGNSEVGEGDEVGDGRFGAAIECCVVCCILVYKLAAREYNSYSWWFKRRPCEAKLSIVGGGEEGRSEWKLKSRVASLGEAR